MPRRIGAWIDLDAKSRQVLSVGGDPAQMRKVAVETKRVEYIRQGGIGDLDAAEAAVRYELRKHLEIKSPLAPRVLVASPGEVMAKRVIKEVFVNAGARDVITVPRTMAAAIGMDLDVDRDTVWPIMYVDRDWLSVAFIAQAKILSEWEQRTGVDDLEREAHAIGRPVGNFDPLKGSGRSDMSASMILRLWREHYVEALNHLEARDRRCAISSAIYLTGPEALYGGLQAAIQSLWAQPVVVKPKPEMASILGCRRMLGLLDTILASSS